MGPARKGSARSTCAEARALMPRQQIIRYLVMDMLASFQRSIFAAAIVIGSHSPSSRVRFRAGLDLNGVIVNESPVFLLFCHFNIGIDLAAVSFNIRRLLEVFYLGSS